jgi:hypothetical protein
VKVPLPSAGDVTIATVKVKARSKPKLRLAKRPAIPGTVSATVGIRRGGRRIFRVLVVVASRTRRAALVRPAALTLSLGFKGPFSFRFKKRRDALRKVKPTGLPKECRDNAPNPLARLPRRLRKRLGKPATYLHPWAGVSAKRFQRQLFLAGTCWRPLAMKTYALLRGVQLRLGASSIRSGTDNLISFSPGQLTPNIGVWVSPHDAIGAVNTSPGFRFGVMDSGTASWDPSTYALARGPFQRDQQHTIVFETRTSVSGEPTVAQKILLVPPGSTAVAGPSFEIK